MNILLKVFFKTIKFLTLKHHNKLKFKELDDFELDHADMIVSVEPTKDNC